MRTQSRRMSAQHAPRGEPMPRGTCGDVIKHGGAALSGGERHQIVVHVDAETLRTGTAGRCEIEEATSLPARDCSPTGLRL